MGRAWILVSWIRGVVIGHGYRSGRVVGGGGRGGRGGGGGGGEGGGEGEVIRFCASSFRSPVPRSLPPVAPAVVCVRGGGWVTGVFGRRKGVEGGSGDCIMVCALLSYCLVSTSDPGRQMPLDGRRFAKGSDWHAALSGTWG